MSLPADVGFSAAVTEGHSYARQAFVCDATGEILEELPIDPQTSIDVGTGLVRRSGTLVIPNRNGDYTPESGGLIDFGRSYRLRFTVHTPDGDLSCDQPLLFPDSDEFDIGAHTVTIPVSDGMRIVSADAALSSPQSFPDGTPLEDVVRALLVACGAPDDDAYFDLDAGGEHVTGFHGYEVGVRPADVLAQLMVDHFCDLWAAPPVVYTMRPIPDPLTVEPVATWTLGRQVRLLGLRITRQSRAKNHAVVEGLDPYGQPFTVEVFDTNPASPVAWGTPGIGDLAIHWQSDGIANPEQARSVGRSLLTNYAVSRTFDALLPVDPSLDRRDLVRIIEPTTGIDTVAMLEWLPVPAAPGAHQITVLEGRQLE